VTKDFIIIQQIQVRGNALNAGSYFQLNNAKIAIQQDALNAMMLTLFIQITKVVSMSALGAIRKMKQRKLTFAVVVMSHFRNRNPFAQLVTTQAVPTVQMIPLLIRTRIRNTIYALYVRRHILIILAQPVTSVVALHVKIIHSFLLMIPSNAWQNVMQHTIEKTSQIIICFLLLAKVAFQVSQIRIVLHARKLLSTKLLYLLVALLALQDFF